MRGMRPACEHMCNSVQRRHRLPCPRHVPHPLRLHLLCCPDLQWRASCLPRPHSSPTNAWPSSTWVSAARCSLLAAQLAASALWSACCAAQLRVRVAPAPQYVECGATARASLALRHTCPSPPSFNPFGSGRVLFPVVNPNGTPSLLPSPAPQAPAPTRLCGGTPLAASWCWRASATCRVTWPSMTRRRTASASPWGKPGAHLSASHNMVACRTLHATHCLPAKSSCTPADLCLPPLTPASPLFRCGCLQGGECGDGGVVPLRPLPDDCHRGAAPAGGQRVPGKVAPGWGVVVVCCGQLLKLAKGFE